MNDMLAKGAAGSSPAGGRLVLLGTHDSALSQLLPPEHRLEAVLPLNTSIDEVLAHDPELVLLDLRGISDLGVTSLRCMRADPRVTAIPVITLCDREEICLRSLDEAANDYVTEPIAPEELRAKISAQLTLARAYREMLQRERTLRDEAETLNELALTLTAELDLRALLQKVTDAGTRLTGARYGAFFHNTVNEEGSAYTLYTLAGAPRGAFEHFGIPRATPLFHPTFVEGRTVRSGDVMADPRFGKSAPHHGMPKGHLPVRSYLAASVSARDGRRLGALLFGHPQPHVFTERHERLIQGIAAQAAVAVDNAELYGDAMRIQAALRESERRFRLIADHAPVIIWLIGTDGQLSFVSRTWYEWTGQETQKALGDGWAEVIHPDDRDGARDYLDQALVQRRPLRYEFRIRRHDGTTRHAYAVAHPRFDERGTFLGLVGCTIDVTEEKEATNRLREQDQRKNEFLAMLAHELRNPLAPLANGLELIRLSDYKPEMVEHARQMMQRQIKHMVRLIDDLLDLSRITRGKIELRCERTELRSIVEIALEAAAPLIESAGHRLIVDLPEESLYVLGDLTRLAQVFTNLLNNAAQYTPPGGEIQFRARRQAQCAVISVRDNGIGIPGDMLAQIFDMFVQVDQSLEKLHGGLGIGLTLVHRLVQMHHGSVRAFSQGSGRGSEFVVELPVLPVTAEERPTAEETSPRGG